MADLKYRLNEADDNFENSHKTSLYGWFCFARSDCLDMLGDVFKNLRKRRKTTRVLSSQAKIWLLIIFIRG